MCRPPAGKERTSLKTDQAEIALAASSFRTNVSSISLPERKDVYLFGRVQQNTFVVISKIKSLIKWDREIQQINSLILLKYSKNRFLNDDKFI